MADITALEPGSPLNGLSESLGDTRLCEVNTLFIVSLAIPNGKKQALNSQLKQHWNLSFPDTGTCVRGSDARLAGTSATIALFGLQAEQCLLLIDSDKLDPVTAMAHIQQLLGADAYITELSDSFAILELQGSLMLPAMERLCMLDLSLFNENTVARTVMEHLSVIIERPAPDRVRLYSPRSSAGTFAHAVQTSMHNVHTAETV